MKSVAIDLNQMGSPGLSKQLGAVLLVAGTTLGAGMLAIPVVTGAAGLYPSMLLLVLYWALQLSTAFLMLEVNLWFQQPVNLITMTRHTLGKKCEAIVWLLYLVLLYSLTAAYLAGSGPMVADGLSTFFGIKIPQYAESLPLLAIFSCFIYLGMRPVDYLNRLLMIGLGLSFMALLFSSSMHIDPSLWTRAEPSYLWMSIPVISTSYGFHIIIPNLTTYLHRDVKALRRTLLVGSAIPLIVYLSFEIVILGVVGVNPLKEALASGQGVTQSLCSIVSHPWLLTSAKSFSFFAIVTSFLGVGLSLFRFFADELKIEQTAKGKMGTAVLTFVAPITFVLFYPRGFIAALEYAGICVVLLLGILPVLMVWKGRKTYQEKAPYTVWGGIPLLALLLFFLCIACAYMTKEIF